MSLNAEQIVARYEDAKMLANIACFSIELQIHRIQATNVSSPDFVMQPVVDFHFLITALTRLRKVAGLVSNLSDISKEIKEFDDSLPHLNTIRKALEHIDEYIDGKGWDKNIYFAGWQTIVLDEKVKWLNYDLDIGNALLASTKLFQAITNNPPKAYLAKINQL